ncbi:MULTISPECIES: type II toxin-antitoxin system VapC family toxin [Prauserella salsuginis group]|uniref:Ribonuclease VapC n=2 Tax=Prauserella salsuginis group TaxID=2893672 RepID=A0A839XM17_9PSEU|nr:MULTISPECIES: type II toxin-antitoxin system VapC family toxin [Prauserella salsuginis group]MBB3664922.1 putative nucleic acid-binding protein [Prauserella sediminis]MCR3718392.1 putative nucleic acid-binding protein, contains PIN domain [Prauserella flava]MCR3732962.1 putative nucleic acid-binding protein, contains PIN domain [Prauserella salsuginis]
MGDEVVADASTLVVLLTERTSRAEELGRRLVAGAVHAPHLVDAEVGDVLRKHVLRGDLSTDGASAALAAMDLLVDERYPHAGPLNRGAWELRDRVRFYDGLYVSLAARLDLPLVTADARLGRTHGLPCHVEVVHAGA